jgi:hypothetical protein
VVGAHRATVAPPLQRVARAVVVLVRLRLVRACAMLVRSVQLCKVVGVITVHHPMPVQAQRVAAVVVPVVPVWLRRQLFLGTAVQVSLAT